jgi:hypothetical protein
VDPEMALRAAAERYARRVALAEQLAAEAGLGRDGLGPLDPAVIERLWEEAERRAG